MDKKETKRNPAGLSQGDLTFAEVQSYLKRISEKDVEFGGIEDEVAKAFRETGNEIKDITEEINVLEDTLVPLKKRFSHLTTKMNVYSDMLIAAEERRRKNER